MGGNNKGGSRGSPGNSKDLRLLCGLAEIDFLLLSNAVFDHLEISVEGHMLEALKEMKECKKAALASLLKPLLAAKLEKKELSPCCGKPPPPPPTLVLMPAAPPPSCLPPAPPPLCLPPLPPQLPPIILSAPPPAPLCLPPQPPLLLPAPPPAPYFLPAPPPAPLFLPAPAPAPLCLPAPAPAPIFLPAPPPAPMYCAPPPLPPAPAPLIISLVPPAPPPCCAPPPPGLPMTAFMVPPPVPVTLEPKPIELPTCGYTNSLAVPPLVFFDDIYIHPGYGTSAHPWAYWSPSKGLQVIFERERILRRFDLKKYTLKIATPLGQYSEDWYNGTFKEYLMDISMPERDSGVRCAYKASVLLIEALNATQELVPTELWSTEVNNSSMLLMLSYGTADLAGGILRILPYRLTRLDYAMPIWPFRVGFTYISERESSSNMYVEPFTTGVWWTCLGLALVMILAQRMTAKRPVEKEGAYMAVIATYLQQDASAVPEGFSGRWTFVVLSISSMLIHAYYTSAIVSDLMSTGRSGPDSLRSLADSRYSIASEDYDYMRYLMFDVRTNWEDLEYLKKKKLSSRFYYDIESGVELLRKGNTAYHTEYNQLYPHLKTFTDDQLCKLQYVDTIPESVTWVTTTKRGQWIDIFRSKGGWLHETGLAQRLLSQIRIRPPPCRAALLAERVKFGDIAPVLGLSVLGSVLSFVIMGLEIIFAKMEKGKHLTSLNERMNQMIEALYSSLISKPKSSSAGRESSSESVTGHDYSPSTVSYETAYYPQAYSMPVTASSSPQYIYYSPSHSPVSTALPYAPSLLHNPPMPLPAPSLPSSYYPSPSEPPVPFPEYPYSLKTQQAWPSTYSYEQYSYPQLPYSPPGLYSPPSPPVTHSPPPVTHSPPQYSHPTPPQSYEYKFYPTDYPPPPPSPPRPYQPVPSPPHYAPLPEYSTLPPPHSYSNPQYPKIDDNGNEVEIIYSSPELDDEVIKDFKEAKEDWIDTFLQSDAILFPSSSTVSMTQVLKSDKSPEEQLEEIKEIATTLTKAIQSEITNLLTHALSFVDKDTEENNQRKKRSIDSPMDSTKLVWRLLKHIKSNNEFQNIAIEKMMSAQEIADKYGIEFNPDTEILSELAVAANEQAKELTSILTDAINMKNVTQEDLVLNENKERCIQIENPENMTYHIHSHAPFEQDTRTNKTTAHIDEHSPMHAEHNQVHYTDPYTTYNYYFSHPHETQIPSPPTKDQYCNPPVTPKQTFYDAVSYNPTSEYYGPYCSLEPQSATYIIPIDSFMEPEPELVGEEFEETISSKIYVDHEEEPGVATVNHVMTYTISEKAHYRTPQIESLPQQMQYYFYLM
ncbi:unnamed protein product [Parnassius apollo]|uniref:(apollo) hypothetical protein n=1 Tax=Parnassius apollo TaxID=110799 RepID=A0A8S3XGH0_PARAO|nr:unnamed protein product [Parnassius apollo]